MLNTTIYSEGFNLHLANYKSSLIHGDSAMVDRSLCAMIKLISFLSARKYILVCTQENQLTFIHRGY